MNTLVPAQDDPLRGATPANRDRIYALLRERTPIYWSARHAAWVLTRYADVSALLRNPDALALDMMPFLRAFCERGPMELPDLMGFCASVSLFSRPPRHDLLRRVMAQALGELRRLDFPERLTQRAAALLAAGRQSGGIDLAAGYGRKLALFVIGCFLGIAEDDIPELSARAANFVSGLDLAVRSPRSLKRLDRDTGILRDYFARLIALRRRDAREDGLSLIVRLADAQLDCSDDELAFNCVFFFASAEETTAAAITEAAKVVLERPALRAKLVDAPWRLPHAAREFLRLSTPLQYVARQFQVDTEIGGQLIRAGQPIMLMLAAANRDPSVFPDPDEPDIDRTGPEALVFGAGPYRCLGAQLAAMEVEIAVRQLLQRPDIRLADEPPIWSDGINIVPLQRLAACFA